MRREKTIKERMEKLKIQNIFLKEQCKEGNSNIKKCLINSKIRNNIKTISNLQWVLEG